MTDTHATLFFSWQSDTLYQAERTVIRAALSGCSKKMISDNKNISLFITESVQDTSGALYIPDVIMKKIRQCDIFIADVTPITTLNSIDKNKNIPNPNVVFELGYAVAHLGWDRIILLYNVEKHELNSAPFDFDRHKIIKFNASADEKKSQINTLEGVLLKEISGILTINPPRSTVKSPVDIKQERDALTIRGFINDIDMHQMSQMFSSMPNHLPKEIINISDHIFSNINDVNFYLYNKKSLDIIQLFAAKFENVIKYLDFYEDGQLISHKKLNLRYIGLVDRELGTDTLIEITDAMLDLKQAYKALVKMLHEDYMEIDIRDAMKKSQN